MSPYYACRLQAECPRCGKTIGLKGPGKTILREHKGPGLIWEEHGRCPASSMAPEEWLRRAAETEAKATQLLAAQQQALKDLGRWCSQVNLAVERPRPSAELLSQFELVLGLLAELSPDSLVFDQLREAQGNLENVQDQLKYIANKP